MPTVSSLQTKYQALLAPGNNTEFIRLVQEADDRLLEFGRWNWTRTKTTLTPATDMTVSLPTVYNAILAARVGDRPDTLRPEEFEYVPGEAGEISVTGCAGAGIIDQGFVTKDFGAGTETRRVYKVTGNYPEDELVTALVRWSSASITTTGSVTRCPDYAALKLMMYGIVFEEQNDIERSSSYVATALRSLDNKEKSFRAGIKQSLPVSPYGYGISGIRNMR